MTFNTADPFISYLPHIFLKNICSAPSNVREPDGTLVQDPLGRMEMLDPTSWAVWFDDFLKYDKAQGTGYYTFTDDGGDCADTLVGPTGVVTLTTSGNDNDFGQLMLTDAPIQLTANKKAIFEARFKITVGGGTIAETEFVVGLTSPQAEAAAAFMDAGGTVRTFDDGVAFISYDGTANVVVAMGENDVFTQEGAVTTIVDDTWMVLSIYWDGTAAHFYKDNAWLAKLYHTMPTSVIGPMFFVREGEAQTRAMAIDYWLAAVER